MATSLPLSVYLASLSAKAPQGIKYEGLSYGIDIYRNENQKTSKEIGIFMVISI
jgi:hypothetical protein